MDKAIKELEELFGTTAKGNVVYFNDVTYTPIPLPVQEAVKVIMSEYPDLGYQLGLYSVKVLDKNVHPIHISEPIEASYSKKKELESSRVGDIHDEYIMLKANENEVLDKLKNCGYDTRKAKDLIRKWKPEIITSSRKPIKSSLSHYFPVSDEEAKELNELEETFGNSRSELRSVLEDFFHIYDDYAEMSVQEFDTYLAEYFNSEDLENDI